MSRVIQEKSYSCLAASIEQARQMAVLSPRDSHLIIGVSGGRDSMLLMDLLHRYSKQLSIKVSIAHLDHGLRKDSFKDAGFVKATAEQLGLACYIRKVNPPVPAKNLESWGRGERYKFFEELRQELAANAICTAHHLDDQAETFLMRLCSGRLVSSIDCIEMISRERLIVRPMLKLSRNEISTLVEFLGLKYLEDESNTSSQFLRNRVRHEVMPVLRDVFSDSLSQVLVQTLSRLQEDEKAIESFASEASAGVPKWREINSIAEEQLGERFHLIGYSDYQRICSCLSTSQNRERVVELGSGLSCKVSVDGSLSFIDDNKSDGEAEPDSQQQIALSGPLPLSIQWSNAKIRIDVRQVESESLNKECGDASEFSTLLALPADASIEELELEVRKRREGDSATLLSGKQRSLKKLFHDAAIPLARRWDLPVVVLNQELVWVPGVVRSNVARCENIQPGVPSRIIELRVSNL